MKKSVFFSKIMLQIHNESITKKYLLDHPMCSTDLIPIENVWRLIVAKVYEGGRQYKEIFEPQNTDLEA